MTVALVATIVAIAVGTVSYLISVYLLGVYLPAVVGLLAIGSGVGVFSLADRLGLVPPPHDDSTRLFRRESAAQEEDERKAKR